MHLCLEVFFKSSFGRGICQKNGGLIILPYFSWLSISPPCFISSFIPFLFLMWGSLSNYLYNIWQRVHDRVSALSPSLTTHAPDSSFFLWIHLPFQDKKKKLSFHLQDMVPSTLDNKSSNQYGKVNPYPLRYRTLALLMNQFFLITIMSIWLAITLLPTSPFIFFLFPQASLPIPSRPSAADQSSPCFATDTESHPNAVYLHQEHWCPQELPSICCQPTLRAIPRASPLAPVLMWRWFPPATRQGSQHRW